jgi:hypothetical protein
MLAKNVIFIDFLWDAFPEPDTRDKLLNLVSVQRRKFSTYHNLDPGNDIAESLYEHSHFCFNLQQQIFV